MDAPVATRSGTDAAPHALGGGSGIRRTRTRSTCCYCGVGCGVVIEAEHGPAGSRIVGVEGDPDHPANFGRLCSKGHRLAETARSDAGRALQPELRHQRHEARRAVDWGIALDTVAHRLSTIIAEHGRDSVGFYLSGQLLTEDYYVFNKLAKGLVGTANVDTNSRLCMSSAVSAYKLALGADGPPTCYEDLELAKTVLFAGSNAAHAHPVLFRRLEAARECDPSVRWIVVDPRRTDTAAMADLHLAVQPGTDVALFNGMLHHLIWEDRIDRSFIATHTAGFDALKDVLRDYAPRTAAEICGIPVADLVEAAEWFGRSPASLSLYCMGLNQSVHGTDKNLALIHLHLATGQIGRPGAGPFSLTGQPNAMGGREVGGLATMLAAHRDIANDGDRAELERLWALPAGRLPSKPGLPAVAMFDALRDGRLKAVWIACTNPVHSLPDNARVRDALARAEFVVVQDAFVDTDTVPFADVLLPAASWGEKDGTVTNSERRISRVRAAVPPPGQARTDLWIACEVAKRMEARLGVAGQPALFDFAGPAAVYDEHVKLTVGRDLDIGGLDHARLDADGPQQWPFPAGATTGASRRYGDGRFETADGRARFHPTPWRPPAEPTNAHYPLRLLTGRLRDQWHGMSRTGRLPELFAHSPRPALRMCPADAARRGLSGGMLVQVESRRGRLVLPLELSDEVSSGTVFTAMHWSGQHLSSGGINVVCQPAVDARSQQPELKHAAVRVEPAAFGWHLLAARRGDPLALHQAIQPLLARCGYAAIALYPDAGDPALAWCVLHAAHPEAQAEDWMQCLVEAFDLQPGADTLEYRDARRGLLKRVAWRADSPPLIDGLLWADSQPDPASEALLERALSGEPWAGSRLGVLSGALAAVARDPVVCSCRGVRLSAIRTGIAQGDDLAALKQGLGCGTVCGSCIPELTRLCAASPRAALTERGA